MTLIDNLVTVLPTGALVGGGWAALLDRTLLVYLYARDMYRKWEMFISLSKIRFAFLSQSLLRRIRCEKNH